MKHHPEIFIFVDGQFVSSTTDAKSLRVARKRYADKHQIKNMKRVRAKYKSLIEKSA